KSRYRFTRPDSRRPRSQGRYLYSQTAITGEHPGLLLLSHWGFPRCRSVISSATVIEMNGLVLADQLLVKFHGDRGGDGPMTLGQHNTIQWMGLRPDYLLSSVEWVFQVPETAGIDDVSAAWSVLISRHESLRTTYPPVTGPDGWPVQRVTASGAAAIDVYEVDGAADAVAAARALIQVLRERPF